MTIPDLDAFLAAPHQTVAAVAPQTIIFAPAGSKRLAAIERIPMEHYSEWVMRELSTMLPMFFRLGVRHVILPTLGPKQFLEPVVGYQDQILNWVVQFSLGASLTQAAFLHGFRVRMIGPAIRSVPTLRQAAAKLLEQHCNLDLPVLWLYVVQSDEEPWMEVIDAARRTSATVRSDLVRALYEEDIPSATVLIGSGRPMLHTRIVPPLLFDDDLQCYWTQCAGVRISEEMIRRVIYDATFSRNTYTEERATRYHHADKLRQHWEGQAIMGIGQNMFGFWVPQAFP